MTALAALHAGPSFDAAMLAAIGVATVGSTALFAMGLIALRQRRSRSYLLVALALGALFARTGVAALAAVDAVEATPHHFLEHGLDAVMAALVIAAVYHARTVERKLSEVTTDE